VFVSYARADVRHLQKFRQHVANLGRHGLLFSDDWDICGGDDWQKAVAERIDAADIVVLLLTQSFVASRFCTDEEFPQSLRRHGGELVYKPARVVAINAPHPAPVEVGISRGSAGKRQGFARSSSAVRPPAAGHLRHHNGLGESLQPVLPARSPYPV
jgi:hypothetical protein